MAEPLVGALFSAIDLDLQLGLRRTRRLHSLGRYDLRPTSRERPLAQVAIRLWISTTTILRPHRAAPSHAAQKVSED